MENRLEITIENIAKNNLPFVFYRLPNDDYIHFVAQNDQFVKQFDLKDLDENSGFILASFSTKDTKKAYCLAPDFVEKINTKSDELDKMLSSAFINWKPENSSAHEVTKQEYLESTQFLIDSLKNGELRKVVLSRVLSHSLPDSFDPAHFFKALLEKDVKSFTYFFYLPEIGSWTGATPETLFAIESDHAETVALAGTQPADNFEWTEKEITEQRIVMDYIEELLFKFDINEYGRTGPYTIKAGDIVHLKTRYNLSLEQVDGRVGELVSDLHPTPAVSGLPRSKSYDLIKKVEKHDRSFYSGFLGPWKLSGDSKLYVNLRCAEILKDKMRLYVGGGLTAQSIPEAEWEETVRKSKTLLSVLEKM